MTRKNRIKMSDMKSDIYLNNSARSSDITLLSSRVSKLERCCSKSEMERLDHEGESNRSMLFNLKSRIGSLEYKIDAIATFLNLNFEEVDYHIECKPKELLNIEKEKKDVQG